MTSDKSLPDNPAPHDTSADQPFAGGAMRASRMTKGERASLLQLGRLNKAGAIAAVKQRTTDAAAETVAAHCPLAGASLKEIIDILMWLAPEAPAWPDGADEIAFIARRAIPEVNQ